MTAKTENDFWANSYGLPHILEHEQGEYFEFRFDIESMEATTATLPSGKTVPELVSAGQCVDCDISYDETEWPFWTLREIQKSLRPFRGRYSDVVVRLRRVDNGKGYNAIEIVNTEPIDGKQEKVK